MDSVSTSLADTVAVNADVRDNDSVFVVDICGNSDAIGDVVLESLGLNEDVGDNSAVVVRVLLTVTEYVTVWSGDWDFAVAVRGSLEDDDVDFVVLRVPLYVRVMLPLRRWLGEPLRSLDNERETLLVTVWKPDNDGDRGASTLSGVCVLCSMSVTWSALECRIALRSCSVLLKNVFFVPVNDEDLNRAALSVTVGVLVSLCDSDNNCDAIDCGTLLSKLIL